jgi:hypothetical protein
MADAATVGLMEKLVVIIVLIGLLADRILFSPCQVERLPAKGAPRDPFQNCGRPCASRSIASSQRNAKTSSPMPATMRDPNYSENALASDYLP